MQQQSLANFQELKQTCSCHSKESFPQLLWPLQCTQTNRSLGFGLACVKKQRETDPVQPVRVCVCVFFVLLYVAWAEILRRSKSRLEGNVCQTTFLPADVEDVTFVGRVGGTVPFSVSHLQPKRIDPSIKGPELGHFLIQSRQTPAMSSKKIAPSHAPSMSTLF